MIKTNNLSTSVQATIGFDQGNYANKGEIVYFLSFPYLYLWYIGYCQIHKTNEFNSPGGSKAI